MHLIQHNIDTFICNIVTLSLENVVKLICHDNYKYNWKYMISINVKYFFVHLLIKSKCNILTLNWTYTINNVLMLFHVCKCNNKPGLWVFFILNDVFIIINVIINFVQHLWLNKCVFGFLVHQLQRWSQRSICLDEIVYSARYTFIKWLKSASKIHLKLVF